MKNEPTSIDAAGISSQKLRLFMRGGAPAAGWTLYAPLTLQMGPSMDASIFALHILGASSIMGRSEEHTSELQSL